MGETALAPGNHTSKLDTRPENPFASPSSISSASPTIPKPCAYPPYTPPSSWSGATNNDTNTRHDRSRQHSVYTPYKSGSMSSGGDSALMTPVSSMELEKPTLVKEKEPKRSSRESKRSKSSNNRDPEKASHLGWNSQPPSNRGFSAVTYDEDEDEMDEVSRKQEEKAVKILLFLSGPCVLLSVLNTVWVLVAVVITALTQPIRLCAKRPNFGQQLAGLLGPTLNLQLRCIYTPLPPHANEDASYHTFKLVTTHLFSPFLSFAMMFAAWTLAVYWMSSAAVGDPAGQDKRDDGKETVLGLRNWWERFLMRSVKEE